MTGVSPRFGGVGYCDVGWRLGVSGVGDVEYICLVTDDRRHRQRHQRHRHHRGHRASKTPNTSTASTLCIECIKRHGDTHTYTPETPATPKTTPAASNHDINEAEDADIFGGHERHQAPTPSKDTNAVKGHQRASKGINDTRDTGDTGETRDAQTTAQDTNNADDAIKDIRDIGGSIGTNTTSRAPTPVTPPEVSKYSIHCASTIAVVSNNRRAPLALTKGT